MFFHRNKKIFLFHELDFDFNDIKSKNQLTQTNIQIIQSIMETNPFLMFLIRYLFCVGLLIYTYKSKKQNNILKIIIISFAVFSMFMVVDYILEMTFIFNDNRPFFEVNFVDFLIVTLGINAFSKQQVNENPNKKQ